MQALRRRLQEAHPRETLQQFIDRLFEQFEETLARYEQLFSPFSKTLTTRAPPDSREGPNGAPGRRRRALAERVAIIASRGRRKIPDVAREVLRDDWKERDPRRYDTLMGIARDHQDHAKSYTLSDRRALNHTYCEATPDFCNWEYEHMLFSGL